MEKAYTKTNWQNLPSKTTPLGATNLNKIENGLNEIDNRVISIQGQVDAIVVEGDSSLEAAQARVNADGSVTYGTLKERLDAEFTEIANKTIESGTEYPIETYPNQMFFKIV